MSSPFVMFEISIRVKSMCNRLINSLNSTGGGFTRQLVRCVFRSNALILGEPPPSDFFYDQSFYRVDQFRLKEGIGLWLELH